MRGRSARFRVVVTPLGSVSLGEGWASGVGGIAGWLVGGSGGGGVGWEGGGSEG